MILSVFITVISGHDKPQPPGCLLGLEVFRARIAANGRGDITVGGETVSIVYDATNGRFSSSGGNDGLLSELLILGFNNGPRALSERMLSMLSDSGEAQSQESIQTKYLNVSFLLVQEISSARQSLFSVQLHWRDPKRECLSKIQIVQQYALYLMLMHFLAWLMTVQFTL